MTDLATDNPASSVSDNASMTSQPDSGINGTGSRNENSTDGQAQSSNSQGGAPDEIFKGIDPNRLTPNEKANYNSMLKDYREKTGRLSETIKSETEKATKAYRDKASQYDQIAQQEEFVKQWNEYVQKEQSQSNQNETQGTTNPVLTRMEQKLQEMSQKMEISELSQVTDAFAEAVNEKGEKLHPDFDQFNSITIGKLQNGEEYSLLRACIELTPGNNPQEKLVNGYKMAKAVHAGIFESGKKSGMGRLQTKVLNGTNPPSNSGNDVLSITDKKPKNAREAMEMARKGLMVSRE